MKHQTPKTNLFLLFAAVVITWASCQQPEKPPPVCFPGKHVIPDSVAAKYQMRFIESYNILKRIAPDTFLARHFRIPNAETFGRAAMCALIADPRVDSVRIFYGEDTTGGFRLMLKGVDRYGKVLVIKYPRPDVSDTTKMSTKLPQDDGGDALENGQTCPPCMVDGSIPPPNN